LLLPQQGYWLLAVGRWQRGHNIRQIYYLEFCGGCRPWATGANGDNGETVCCQTRHKASDE